MSTYIVFDLEMCKVPKYYRKTGFGVSTEIIQIGAVAINEEYETVGRFETFVKPQCGIIDAYIQNLTGIAPSDVCNAPNLFEALTSFLQWLPEDAVLVSWSQNDTEQIHRELEVKAIELPGLMPYLDGCIDCQEIFSDKMNTEKVYRLSEALAIADIDYDENMHNALSDACNTALLFVKTQKEDVLVLSPYLVSDSDLPQNPFGRFEKSRCYA